MNWRRKGNGRKRRIGRRGEKRSSRENGGETGFYGQDALLGMIDTSGVSCKWRESVERSTHISFLLVQSIMNMGLQLLHQVPVCVCVCVCVCV